MEVCKEKNKPPSAIAGITFLLGAAPSHCALAKGDPKRLERIPKNLSTIVAKTTNSRGQLDRGCGLVVLFETTNPRREFRKHSNPPSLSHGMFILGHAQVIIISSFGLLFCLGLCEHGL